jgi:hypothetical protein
LPIRTAIIPILLAIGWWGWAGEVRGQAERPGASRADVPDQSTAGGVDPRRQQELERIGQELRQLGQAQAQAKAAPRPEIDRLKEQVDLQQKQIDVLLRMTQLLADQVRKQPATAAAVESLQEQVATQDARAQRAARRDQELARTRDDILDRLDASMRNDPPLPATLRELFAPYRNNESPLTIYGSVAQSFDAFSQLNSTFRDQTLELRPYLLLNEKFLMSGNVGLQQGTVQLWRAQAEWFINDHWTFVAGRFYSPIGFFSERLRLNWVIKTPDPPLMFNQVYPAQLSFDGLQLRGARYVFDWPVKLEYSGFVANGLSVAGAKLSPSIYSNLNNFTDTGNDINGAKAWGGRVGLSFPRIGVIAGLSGLANQAYSQAGQTLNLWDVDASWHKGNWDARFELAKTDQQTPAPAPSIHRFGFYAQLAYRQYDNPNPFLQKLEGVFRFDHVMFDGINIAQTGLNFGGLGLNYARQPLDRNRFTIGANYWFYPSLVMKLAIEFNDELGSTPSLRDNGFIGQIVWGF